MTFSCKSKEVKFVVYSSQSLTTYNFGNTLLLIGCVIKAKIIFFVLVLLLDFYNLEHPNPYTAMVWHMAKLDEKCYRLFQIASRATTFPCLARILVKLILVRFILHSIYDWSIDYLRGRFGVPKWPSFSWRAFQMKKQNLSVSNLVKRVDAFSIIKL